MSGPGRETGTNMFHHIGKSRNHNTDIGFLVTGNIKKDRDIIGCPAIGNKRNSDSINTKA
jgi:hypothetical protein